MEPPKGTALSGVAEGWVTNVTDESSALTSASLTNISTTNIGEMAYWSPLKPQEVTGMAIAQPVADPGLNVDPVQAAKELRALMRLALDYMDSAHTTQESTVMTEIDSRLDMIAGYTHELEEQLLGAETALTKRQTSPGKAAIAEARLLIHRIRNQRRYIKDFMGQIPQGPTMSFQPHTIKHLNQTLAKMHILIQAFPTIKEAPSSIPENVLRTIAVVLENSGYVAKKAPDELPDLHAGDDIENEEV